MVYQMGVYPKGRVWYMYGSESICGVANRSHGSIVGEV